MIDLGIPREKVIFIFLRNFHTHCNFLPLDFSKSCQMLGKNETFSNWRWAEVLLYSLLREGMGQWRGDLQLRFNVFFIIWKSYFTNYLWNFFQGVFTTPPTINLNLNVYSQRGDFPALKDGLRIKWDNKVCSTSV